MRWARLIAQTLQHGHSAVCGGGLLQEGEGGAGVGGSASSLPIDKKTKVGLSLCPQGGFSTPAILSIIFVDSDYFGDLRYIWKNSHSVIVVDSNP